MIDGKICWNLNLVIFMPKCPKKNLSYATQNTFFGLQMTPHPELFANTTIHRGPGYISALQLLFSLDK